jgi:fructokinase
VIAVAGEALVDLIGDEALRPHPGGGPYNIAVALARLGDPAAFLGGLSTDGFGRLIASDLAASGVDDRYVRRTALPTPLAVVQRGADGGHDFTFYLAGTAYTDLQVVELGSEVEAVCTGTLALATDPPAAAIEALLEREQGRRLIVLDPNVRPPAVADGDAYRDRLDRLFRLADVVKLSDADAAWLYPGDPVEAVLDDLIAHGVRLAAMTLGAEGAIARTAAATALVQAPPVEVVDTVGAGDAFVAGLVHGLRAGGVFSPDALAILGAEELADVLAFAAAVAAAQCTRAGADPPTLAEVEAMLGPAHRNPLD